MTGSNRRPSRCKRSQHQTNPTKSNQSAISLNGGIPGLFDRIEIVSQTGLQNGLSLFGLLTDRKFGLVIDPNFGWPGQNAPGLTSRPWEVRYV